MVLEHQVIPDGSLAVGNPAKVVRTLSETEREKLYENSREYVRVENSFGQKDIAERSETVPLQIDGYCLTICEGHVCFYGTVSGH